MNGIIIREATECDLPSIIRLYAVAGGDDGTSFTDEEAHAHFGVFKRYPSFRIFVAIVDGLVVGTYELLVMDNFAKRGAKSGIVKDVAVDPSFGRRAVGRAMLEHAREQSRQSQCYKLLLSSNVGREDAHRFYEALGFRRHGYSFQVEP